MGGRYAIDRIESYRHQHGHPEKKRRAQAQDALPQEAQAAVAFNARIGEDAGDEEQQRHQVDVRPGAERVKPEPAVCVEDWRGEPSVGWAVEGKGLCLDRGEIGEARMHREL